MSDTPRSAADKATEFLYLHNSLCRSQHLHHRAMLTDNCERGSAQKAATFDADDLSALMVDLREVEAKNDLLREANFALVADLSALQRETLKDGKRLTDARAENTALRVALEAETARAEYVRGLRDSLERELAEARNAYVRATTALSCETGRAEFVQGLLDAARAEVKALREEGASTFTAMEAIRVDAEQRSEKAQKELYRQNINLRAEVERARKDGFIAGRHAMGLLHDDLTPMTDDEAYEAWARREP